MANVLEKEELKKYLQKVIDLESSIFEQNMIITNYNQYCERKKPQLKEKEKIAYPPLSNDISGKDRLGNFCLVCGVVFFFIIFLASGSSGVSFVVSLIFSLLIIIPGILCKISYKNDENKWNEECHRISERNTEIENSNKTQLMEYNMSLSKWDSSKNEVLQWMNAPLSETKSALEKLYSLDVIYPKYRTLPALTCIYEYLQSGRCEELSGTHGAYNLYEDELRKNTIISQLNTIIENLEQIKQNQYLLYIELHQILINTQSISTKLEQINYNTTAILGLAELSTYYNGITAANTSALAYYETMR